MNKYDENRDPKVIAMLNEIAEVCKKYGLSLSHEDHHGGFQVEHWSSHNEDWLLAAAEVVKDKL